MLHVIEPKNLPIFLHLSRTYAAHLGVPHDSIEDCAAEFAERMLKASTADLMQCRVVHLDRWLHCCARNHTLSFLLKQRRLADHELQLSSCSDGRADPHRAGSAADPFRDVIIHELDSFLYSGISELTTDQKVVTAAHYLDGASVKEIATFTHRSPDAVSKLLARARIRLRKWFECNGVTGDGVEEYLGVIHGGGLPLVNNDYEFT